jgi:hypothetical protein
MIVLQGFHDLVQQIVLRAEPPGPDWYIILPTIALAIGTAVLVIVTAYYARQTNSLVGQTDRMASQTERLATSKQQLVTRTSLSEQIKNSRDVWVRINEKYDPIIEIMRSEDQSRFTDDRWNMLRPLAWDIDYFAFLILTGEISDETLLSYYRRALSGYIEAIMRNYATAGEREDLRNEYPNFNRLINKWNINVPNEES